MTPVTRQAKIAELVRRNKRVTVNELASTLEISKETIRRDLTSLARSGKVVKFHGGATLPVTTGEGPFSERMGENVAAKAHIASIADKIIAPGETVFIDTGSTSVYFAERLAEIPNLTVVTNSAEIARIVSLSSSGSSAFLLGGQYSGCNRQTVGSLAISQASLFRAHHAILTIGAVDEQTGIMDYSVDEAQVAQAMINQAEQVTVIVDSSKFNKIASFKVCGLGQVTNLVSERMPPENLNRMLNDAGVNVIIAPL